MIKSSEIDALLQKAEAIGYERCLPKVLLEGACLLLNKRIGGNVQRTARGTPDNYSVQLGLGAYYSIMPEEMSLRNLTMNVRCPGLDSGNIQLLLKRNFGSIQCEFASLPEGFGRKVINGKRYFELKLSNIVDREEALGMEVEIPFKVLDILEKDAKKNIVRAFYTYIFSPITLAAYRLKSR